MALQPMSVLKDSRSSSLRSVLHFARHMSGNGFGHHSLWNEESDQGPQLALFTERVELVTFHLLPSAVSKVTATYAKLRTLLLSEDSTAPPARVENSFSWRRFPYCARDPAFLPVETEQVVVTA